MPADSGTRDVAIAGIGATAYCKRGETAGTSINQLAGEAILAACEDAGVSVKDVDGLAFYSLARAGYGDQFGMPDDETFASSGHKAVADRLYRQAGVTPGHRRRADLRPLHADGADAAGGLRLLQEG